MQFLEVLTIGIPFCVFKILTGLFYGQQWLVALGVLDTAINLVNMMGIIFFKRRLLSACLLSLIVSSFKRQWEDLGNSLDVALAFCLVALMIAYGNLGKLPQNHLTYWNISVVFNVLGAGLSRITSSIKNLPQ